MEQAIIDKFMELKKLHEAGVLTKEEFEVEKQKLLNSESNKGKEPVSTDDTSDVSQKTEFSELPQPTSSSMKWFIIGGIIIVFLIIVLVVSNNSKSSQSYYAGSTYNYETGDTVYEDEYDEYYSVDDSEEDTEHKTVFWGAWFKNYFHNEWDEAMYEHPYISTTMSSDYLSLMVLYSHEVGFRFSILDDDNDHRLWHIYSPVSFMFRDSNGETYEITADFVENYVAHVQDSDNIRLIANLLNSGKFDVLMRYEMYNEMHSTRWTFNDRAGNFMKAVENLLEQ